jgi:chromosome partitioning protein
VDCDPQSNATSGLGLVKDPERINTYHMLVGTASAEEAVQATSLEQLWLVPAHKNLIGANIELVEAERREFRLRDALAPLYSRYEFIVLDCPPALDLLTLNALVAADAVLIPMQAEYFALEGISELLDTVERIRASFNPDLGIEGVVLTMFDERTNLAQQVTAELKRFFGEKLCGTTIPRNIRLAEAPSHGKPALLYDPRSKGAESYIRLAKEIIAHQMLVSEPMPESAGAGIDISGPGSVAEELQADQSATDEAAGPVEVAVPKSTDGQASAVAAGAEEHTANVEEMPAATTMDKSA